MCPELYDLETGRLIRETVERPLELGIAYGDEEQVELHTPEAIYRCHCPVREGGGCGVLLWHGEVGGRRVIYFERREGKQARPYYPGIYADRRVIYRWEQGRRLGEAELRDLRKRVPVYEMVRGSAGLEWPAPFDHECELDPLDTTTGVSCRRVSTWGDPVVGSDGAIYTGRSVFPGNPNAGFHILKWTWEE